MTTTNAFTSAEWYAVRVKSRFERAVQASLSGKDYEVFLPLYTSRRRWSDRTKVLELPLFAGYLFCRFDARARLPILTSAGVVGIVGFGGIPAAVDASEIEAIRMAVRSGRPLEPWPYLKTGEWAYVAEGPLAGIEGIVAQERGSFRIVLSVTLLQRSVTVEIDRESVRPTRRVLRATAGAPVR